MRRAGVYLGITVGWGGRGSFFWQSGIVFFAFSFLFSISCTLDKLFCGAGVGFRQWAIGVVCKTVIWNDDLLTNMCLPSPRVRNCSSLFFALVDEEEEEDEDEDEEAVNGGPKAMEQDEADSSGED